MTHAAILAARPKSVASAGASAAPQIMDAPFLTADKWAISQATGTNAGFDTGGGSTPVSPHTVPSDGIYEMVVPTSTWTVGNYYTVNEGNAAITTIEMDFDIKMSIAPAGQMKGMRYQTGQTAFPSGTGLGGLLLCDINGNTLGALFEGGNSDGTNFEFEAYWADVGGASSMVLVDNLADNAWHSIRYWYDFGTTKRRQRLEIDGTFLTRPDGTGVISFGARSTCGTGWKAEWQGGWIEVCDTLATEALTGSKIGGGLFNDNGHATAGPTMQIRNVVWRDATGLV